MILRHPVLRQLMLLLLTLNMIMRLVKKKLVFKNNASFIDCISKTNRVSTDNAEDLNVVMTMYNFLEYCKIYSDTIGSVWAYLRNEPNSDVNGSINY